VLSFSAISSYRECPRQFWFRYRHRLHAPPTPEAQFGTAVHEVLREAAERRSLDQEITPQFLSELNRQVWDTQELADGRRRRAFEALAGRELESYRRGGGFDSPPFAVEHQFEIQIDAWTLRGVIDRIDRPLQAGGAWRLIDYKTGAPKPKSNFRTHLQLALYALGARSEFGFEQMDLQVAYLRDGKTSTVEATEDLMEEARRIGAEVAGGVAAGQFSARPQVRRCQLCAYRLSCPDGW
jgi:RecB family exonuclease